MSTPDLLQHQARLLRAASPKEWERFVEIFDVWATEVTVAVTQAPQNEILNQQGKAQAFLHLLKIFRECHKASPQP